MKKCAACGTTSNINGSLGGILLCRDHYADISAQVEILRADGKQVDVTKIAREMFREQFSTTYLLRDIPDELWDRAKHRAVDDGVSLRELVLTALEKHLS